MSKKMNMAKENYLWLKGQSLRTSHPISWWHGFRAARYEFEESHTKPLWTGSTELDQAAFQSGYDYYREVYHEQA